MGGRRHPAAASGSVPAAGREEGGAHHLWGLHRCKAYPGPAGQERDLHGASLSEGPPRCYSRGAPC